MKILYVSWMAPYSKVRHAGGQTLNYYIRKMAEAGHDVTLLSFCMEDEEEILKRDFDRVRVCPVVRRKNLRDLLGNFRSIPSKLLPRHRLCGLLSAKSEHMMLTELRKLRKDGYAPDVTVLEWTEMVLLSEKIRKIFPDTKLAASEHDVTFQRLEREAATEGTERKRIRAEHTRRRELAALSVCDRTVVHNEKDRELLLSQGFPDRKIFTIVPYYHRSVLPYQRKNNRILYFGNMLRKENKEAADWFAREVMPRIADLPCEFTVLGNGARYVESIDQEFSEAMCFVCPLFHGAGIKVKVLEALYAGLPVLTGGIGIEGIPAAAGKDYYFCETPEEYEKAVRRIYAGARITGGRELLDEKMQPEDSFRRYREMMESL